MEIESRPGAQTHASNPFSNFQRSAEGAGYPALLIVSIACLGLVVAPVALLGLTRSEWVLGVGLLSMIVAVVLMAIAVDAALSEYEEPAARSTGGTGSRGGRAVPEPIDTTRRGAGERGILRAPLVRGGWHTA